MQQYKVHCRWMVEGYFIVQAESEADAKYAVLTNRFVGIDLDAGVSVCEDTPIQILDVQKK